MQGRATERNNRLGALLKRARKDTSYSQTKLAELIGYSQAMICRIEAGSRPVAPEELAGLLQYLNPSQTLREEIDRLLVLPDAPIPSGLSPNRHFLDMLRAMEIAEEVLSFHSERMPAQLQSQQYVLLQHEQFATGLIETEVLRGWEKRQRIFTREKAPIYRALLAESSLKRVPGGNTLVVREQARHLLQLLDAFPRFSLQVVHEGAVLSHVDSDFTWLKKPGKDADAVYVPFGHDGILIKDKPRVDEWAAYWHMAQRAALTEDDTKKLIHELARNGRVGD